ncbi:unnamed protein product [Diplocarpon coronariae]
MRVLVDCSPSAAQRLSVSWDSRSSRESADRKPNLLTPPSPPRSCSPTSDARFLRRPLPVCAIVPVRVKMPPLLRGPAWTIAFTVYGVV